jgi:hypothetical protein
MADTPKFKRPGMTSMPGSIDTNNGSGGDTNGAKGQAVTNVTDTGGGAGEGGGEGGAGCEKYICNCDELDGPIGEYNDALEALSDKIKDVGIKDNLNVALAAVNTALKKIKGKGSAEGDDCGCPENMSGIILKKLGLAAKSVYESCCFDNGPNDPWASEEPSSTPCGKGKDAGLGDLPLLTCNDPISIEDGSSELIQISKIKCVKDTTKKCTEAGRTKIISDGFIDINIPDVGPIMDAGEQIAKIQAYFQTVKTAANGALDVGGAMGNLKQEACITRLLHGMCTHRLNKPNRVLGETETCDKAWAGIPRKVKGYSNEKSFGNYQNCHGLMNDLAKTTLTFGHSKYDQKNPGEEDPNVHNGVRECGENRITVNETIFAPGDGQTAAGGTQAEQAIRTYLEDLKKAFPGGCRDVDNGPIKEFKILKRTTCSSSTKEACPCFASSANKPDLSDEDKKKIIQLRAEIRARQTEMSNNDATKNKILEKGKLLAQAREVATKIGDVAEITRLTISIEKLETNIAELDTTNTSLKSEIQELNNEIGTIQANPEFTGGQCVQFTYRYCPANSTPPATNSDKKGAGELDGPGAGGSGGGAGQSHRNFFDLLNNIYNQMGQNNPCVGENPFKVIYDSCTGNNMGGEPPEPGEDGPSGEVAGKNPYDSGGQTGVNTGPTVSPGSPCSDNDSVKQVPGQWLPGQREAPCPNDQSKRAECVQRLQKIMKNWSSGIAKIENKLDPIADVIGGIVRAVKSINEAMNDINPPVADECGNVNVTAINKKIAVATAAITAATKALDKLKEITDAIEEDDK